jgi:hypothetical protein
MKLLKLIIKQVTEDYAEKMRKEMESKRYSKSDVLAAVRTIYNEQGWSAINNPHRLYIEIKKIIKDFDEWSLEIGPQRSSRGNFGKFAEVF